MHYLGILIKLDSMLEEEATFYINGYYLDCFIAHSPIYFQVGGLYLLDFEYQIFDDYLLSEETNYAKQPFVNLNNGLSYSITGIFCNDNFIVGGIVFKDEFLFSQYSRLENKLISLFVDRIDLSIISCLGIVNPIHTSNAISANTVSKQA